ncbi:MAG: hypothetical protein V7638_3866 [Acidobacteriota bacterium]|jgi:hypothetical protein
MERAEKHSQPQAWRLENLVADTPRKRCRFPKMCIEVEGVCFACPSPPEQLQQIALSAPPLFPGDDPEQFRSVYTEWRSRLIHAAGGCNHLRT